MKLIPLRMLLTFATVLTLVMMLSSCRSPGTYRVDRVDVAGEDSLVFVRPERYTLLGSTAIHEHLEITYESLTHDPNTGFATLRVGVRNRGGQRFWNRRARDLNLAAKAVFFAQPVSNYATTGAPIHQAARKTFALSRGQTYHLEFICPVRNAFGYQVVLSEY